MLKVRDFNCIHLHLDDICSKQKLTHNKESGPAMGMMGRPGIVVDRSMMDDGMGMMGSH
jgi:hypothetical protein